jgi:Flp pilus assembly protein TadG
VNFIKLFNNDEHGLATVEMAIVLPVLLLVLFGIMAGGLYIFARHEMDRAAREAARYCSLYSVKAANCTQANVQTIVNQSLTSTLLTSKVIAPPVITANSPTAGVSTVTISISGSFAPLPSLFYIVIPPLSVTASVIADW